MELAEHFGRGVRVILRNAARDPSLVDDLHQDTMRILLERIRAGAVRDPAQLGSFVASLARNLATQHFRSARRNEPAEAGQLEGLADPSESAHETVLRREQAAMVRQVLNELPLERDREVLRRFYLRQDDKEHICADFELSSLQFNRVLHRARERFRELWQQRALSTDQ